MVDRLRCRWYQQTTNDKKIRLPSDQLLSIMVNHCWSCFVHTLIHKVSIGLVTGTFKKKYVCSIWYFHFLIFVFVFVFYASHNLTVFVVHLHIKNVYAHCHTLSHTLTHSHTFTVHLSTDTQSYQNKSTLHPL